MSYIHVGDRLVCTDDLTPEQKSYVGAVLKAEYLNAMFSGRAVFSPEGLPDAETVFPKEMDDADRGEAKGDNPGA